MIGVDGEVGMAGCRGEGVEGWRGGGVDEEGNRDDVV